MLRFHLDEQVSGAVARALRLHGIDVSTASEAQLRGATDESHLKFAHDGARVLVTHDADFLRLHAAGNEHFGIAYCRHDKHRIGRLVQLLLLLSDCYSPEEMAGTVEFL